MYKLYEISQGKQSTLKHLLGVSMAAPSLIVPTNPNGSLLPNQSA